MWLLSKSRIKRCIMKNKSQIIKGCALALIPTSICSALAGVNFVNRAYAETSSSGYVKYYHESVTISNASFATASNPYSSGNTFSGWSAIETESKAFGAIINTIDDNSSNSFAKNKSSYHLDENPLHYGNDTRVLMINSLTKDGRSQEAKKGYRSTSITLQANSYYKFSVAVKTALTEAQANAGASVSASIYLNGIKDKNGESVAIGYEGITTNNEWKEVTFFVATGKESQSVTFDLYLGSANGQTSQGAVFFDETQGTRYSQNEFYDEINRAGYANLDNYKTFHNDTKSPVFLVSDLLESKPFIANMEDYNFDFEKNITDGTDTLGEEFMIANKQNGHALIQDILNMQPTDFKALTGYDYVGTDLGHGNEQALILFTGEKVNGKMETTSGYVGVESKEIDIKAHAIYKISLKAKVSKIEMGSFYLKVQENDNILATYSSLLTNDSTDNTKETYSLKSGKTSAITSNTENSFENDYQTLTFFVKGHSLFDSSINLELWLGDVETQAKGCVVVDNITVEYATNADYTNASNKLELSSTLPSDQGITNGRFNVSENDKAEENYLVNASSWTVSKESDYCDSGIVYLYDKATYDQMYTSNREAYPWAGIFPGHAKVSSVVKPNNAYLMNNRTKSSQSILSSTFNISANSYHKLAFSYYNQNGTDLTANSKIKVEVIDENGTVLFSKSGISSLDKWGSFEVYFHTHALLSHTAQVKISLGDSEEKVCGMVYLDDFSFTTSSDYADDFETKANKVDLSKLGLNEEATNEVSLSGFYTFADANGNFTTPITQTGTGGLINGRNNAYNEFNDKLKIDGNYLVLSSRNTGYVKMTSNYKLSFKENEFYKISLDLATIFNSSALSAKTDDHDCKYGVSVEIDGFEAVDKLLSADEFKSLEIFYKASSTNSVNLVIKLVTDCEDTYGTALISNLDFASITESDYKSAQTSSDLNDKVYIANQKETTADDDNNNDDNNNDNNTDSSTSDNAWILVPSIITGLAVIIGVIGYAMKHVKLKKIEKVRKESYDRKLAVNHDAIMVQAQKRRDEELDALNKAKEALIKEREALEEEHKQFIKSAREKDGDKISREVERAFKSYNHSINKLNEKINIIKEKIDYTISAEYLLVIERRILAEQDEKASKSRKARKES